MSAGVWWLALVLLLVLALILLPRSWSKFGRIASSLAWLGAVGIFPKSNS